MCRPERNGGRTAAGVAASLLVGSAVLAATAAEPQPYRYAAPVEIAKPAPFVEMALPPAAYAHALQPDLRDLRLGRRRRGRGAADQEARREADGGARADALRPTHGALPWPAGAPRSRSPA